MEMPDALIGSNYVSVLESLQRIEQVLARMARLEAALPRSATSAGRGFGSDSPASEPSLAGRAHGAVARAPSASAHVLAIRENILNTIVRIRQHNEANRQLIAALIRIAGARIDVFRQLKIAGAVPRSLDPSEVALLHGAVPIDVQV